MTKLISTRALLTYAVGCILLLTFSSDTNALTIWQTDMRILTGKRALVGVPGIAITFGTRNFKYRLFEDLDINPSDIGRTFTVNRDLDPDFNKATMILTNGVNDRWGVDFLSDRNLIGGQSGPGVIAKSCV